MDELQKIAARFITLYDDALKAKGLHTLIGIEQEFQLGRDKKYEFTDAKDAISEGKMVERTFYRAPTAISEKLGRKVTFGPLESFYAEYPDGKDAVMEQFEFTTTPSTPLRAAQRVDGMKRFIASHDPAHEKHTELKGSWRAKQIRFPAYSEAGQSYGLHVNVSVNYYPPSAEKNSLRTTYLLSPHFTSPLDAGKVAESLTYGLKSIADSDLLLIADTPSAYQRLKDNTHDAPSNLSKSIRRKPYASEGRSIPSEYRLEYRLPSGKADPYLATLATMSGVYDQLGHTTPHAETDSQERVKLSQGFRSELTSTLEKAPKLDDALCSSLAEARTRFSERSRVVASMKKIAAQYGTAQDLADVERFSKLVLERSHAMEQQEKAQQGRSR